MGRIIRYNVNKPQVYENYKLDSEHWASKNMKGCWLFNECAGALCNNLTSMSLPGNLYLDYKWLGDTLQFTQQVTTQNRTNFGKPLILGNGNFSVEVTVMHLQKNPTYPNVVVAAVWDVNAGANKEWALASSWYDAANDYHHYFGVQIGGTGYWAVPSPVVEWDIGKKYHLVGIRDGSNISLYQNGVLFAGPTNCTTGSITNGTSNIRIGEHPQSANFNSYANFYLMRIFDIALTADQITQLYNNPYQMFYREIPKSYFIFSSEVPTKLGLVFKTPIAGPPKPVGAS